MDLTKGKIKKSHIFPKNKDYSGCNCVFTVGKN